MPHSLFSTDLPDGRQVHIAPLSLDTYNDNQAFVLGDDSGYFIYQIDKLNASAGIEILGKALSYDAAMQLIDIFFVSKFNKSNRV
jgi:hypothetical protein